MSNERTRELKEKINRILALNIPKDYLNYENRLWKLDQ